MELTQHQIEVSGALNVEAVERALTAVWKNTAAASDSEEALLRSRAANLLVFVADESRLADTYETVVELAGVHPCRALILVGDESHESDIQVSVAAFCPNRIGSRSRQLCCEAVTLRAGGRFVSELPSAALPLLLPDLQSFIWWRDKPRFEHPVLKSLLKTVDRFVIDSADFESPLEDFRVLHKFLAAGIEVASVSDTNWERLTSWRVALADFYDVRDYRTDLDNIDLVRIDSVGSLAGSDGIPAQPLLIAGWLSSALGWQFIRRDTADHIANEAGFQFSKDGRKIDVILKTSHAQGVKPGRVIRVELKRATSQPATFVVSRSEDGNYLESSVSIGLQACPARRVPYKNRSTAQLLSREMEIVCPDEVYEQAIKLADQILPT